MKDLFKSLKDLKFDKRMIKWNLNRKILNMEEYKKHLQSLKDIIQLSQKEEIQSLKEDKPKTEK